MPEKRTLERARHDRRRGKAPSTQAGEFVREEIEHIRHGVHGARSAKQAIAIGLSKARRAGITIPPSGKKSHTGSRRPSKAKHSTHTGDLPASGLARRFVRYAGKDPDLYPGALYRDLPTPARENEDR